LLNPAFNVKDSLYCYFCDFCDGSIINSIDSVNSIENKKSVGRNRELLSGTVTENVIKGKSIDECRIILASFKENGANFVYFDMLLTLVIYVILILDIPYSVVQTISIYIYDD
jgi:hypothetical protein